MKLFVSKQAQKEYDKLPKAEQKKASRKLILLENSPFAGKKLSGELDDFRSLYSWPYRIIYHFEKGNREIWVDHIQHRQGVYN